MFSTIVENSSFVEVVELVDTQASEACESNLVGVRVPPSTPKNLLLKSHRFLQRFLQKFKRFFTNLMTLRRI